MNLLRKKKQSILWKCYLIGLGVREAARAAQIHTATVSTYYNRWRKLGVKKFSEVSED